MNQAIPSAATGSAHHHPSAAFKPTPTTVMTESQKHAVVWNASAASARLPIAVAVLRFARASHCMTAIETSASTIPTVLGDGRSRPHNDVTASSPTNAASANSEAPTSLQARRSRRSTSAWDIPPCSAPRRQMRTRPEALSTKLSMPKPRRATLPARRAAHTAMTPSTTFQPTVRYSSRSAWRSFATRPSSATVVLTVPPRARRRRDG